MKRKVASILVIGLIVASLAGCGTKTEATEQTLENNASVVETDAAVDTETVSDETMSTEVIGEDTEVSEFTGAEDDNIVLYAEAGESEFVPQSSYTYYAEAGTVAATEDVPIYNGDGCNVGYIKNGASISVSEKAQEAKWSRFENPIAGTEYDYLYVNIDYITIPMFTVTESDLKQKIIDEIKNLEVTEYTFVDAPSSDMEVFEFRIESEFEDELDFEYWYDQCTDTDNGVLSNYMTYCIECEKDTDNWITCKVYYKDEIPEDVWNQYYYGN